MKKYSFPPLIDADCTILILGSLPGEESLAKQEYYAHPRNAFWKIIFDLFEQEYSKDYTMKCRLLLNNHIALWDMIYSGKREGSLDSAIQQETPNNLAMLLEQYPKISKIILNGKKAESVYRKNFSDIQIPVFTMPSTSPANARLSYLEKRNQWQTGLNL